MNKFRIILSSIENYSLVNYFVLLFSWIFLRIFFEGILEGTHRIGYSYFSYREMLMYFVHFPLFYLATFLLIVIAMSLILNLNIVKVTKVASIGTGLIIIVPLIDAIFCGGCFITYPSRLEKFFLHFLNPFVSLVDIGVSSGQRIVIFLICLLAGLYGYIIRNKFISGITTFLVVLVIILFSGGLTTILAGNRPENIYITGGILNTDTQKFSAIYFIFFLIVFFFYLYFLDRKDFHILISSMRVERLAFYGCVSLCGFILATKQSGVFHKIDLFNFLGIFLIFLCPSFGFWALQLFNDFFDLPIDEISRKSNPVLMGIKRKYYFLGCFSIFLIVIIGSFILNYQAFLIMTAFLLLGIIYSMPPVRLKRFPLISTFIIAVVVILSISIGYSIIYFEEIFAQIPNRLIFALLSGITIGFSAKDIGHIEGDRKNGVITLPVLLYKKETLSGRFPFSLLLSSSFMIITIFIPKILPGSLIAFFITFFYTLLSKNPKEWLYFSILYLFSFYLLFRILF